MIRFTTTLFAALALLPAKTSMAASTGSTIQDEISYTNDIRPIVKNFCTSCHAGKKPEGKLRLTSYAQVRKEAEQGELLQRINDHDDPMPEDGLMPQYMRHLFQLWVDGGYINKGKGKPRKIAGKLEDFKPPIITPVDINRKGFEFLEKMQGHWIGSLNLMGTEYEWMAFDYRAIAPSHVHGIYEAGTLGNLFTSFFVANYKGTETLMARNGGMLNGIYRTSYFVLDHVEQQSGGSYYRFVDAYGGDKVMRMELTFYEEMLEFNSYTSRFGMLKPKKHFSFQAQRNHPHLAEKAAEMVGFPKKVVERDFSRGMPLPYWGEEYAPITSASYLWEEAGKSVVELGKSARDPYRIDQIPHLSKLKVSIQRSRTTRGKNLLLLLSDKALTEKNGTFITEYGYIREDLLNTLLAFPEIEGDRDAFTFSYLHPGNYYLTVVADMDGDGLPSPGDITHPRQRVTVRPESTAKVKIRKFSVRN